VDNAQTSVPSGTDGIGDWISEHIFGNAKKAPSASRNVDSPAAGEPTNLMPSAREPMKTAPATGEPIKTVPAPPARSKEIGSDLAHTKPRSPAIDGAAGSGFALHGPLKHEEGDPSLPSIVVIDKTHHHTHVLQMHHGELTEALDELNATGKLPRWTPEGRFHVIDKRLDPVWYKPKSLGGGTMAPFSKNHRNPLGMAFIRTNANAMESIGFHGTAPYMEGALGTNASHGCIRHRNDSIMRIYPLVQKGTPVYIVKDFDHTVLKASDIDSVK
jgi:hypothetical protein